MDWMHCCVALLSDESVARSTFFLYQTLKHFIHTVPRPTPSHANKTTKSVFNS